MRNHYEKIPVRIMKPRRVSACVALAVITLATSCGKEPLQAAYFQLIDDGNGTATFAKELNISPDGGVRTLTLISNRDWSIDYEKASWITISPTRGSGVASIRVTVAPNETLDEDFITLSITNNTLLVVKDLKVTRQNYLGTYSGEAAIDSPIAKLCTTCTPGEETKVKTNIVLGVSDDDKISLEMSTLMKLDGTNYTLVTPFKGMMEKVTENGEVKFVYESTGTFDMTPVGEAIGDDSVAGEKRTSVSATLAKGKFTARLIIDPKADGSVDPDVSTVFEFSGKKS